MMFVSYQPVRSWLLRIHPELDALLLSSGRQNLSVTGHQSIYLMRSFLMSSSQTEGCDRMVSTVSSFCGTLAYSGGWSSNWVHSAPRPFTVLLCLPRVIVRMENFRWNEDWQGKRKYSEKTCPSATLSTTNPTWPDPGSNAGRRGGKPATNRFSYGAALRSSSFPFVAPREVVCSVISDILETTTWIWQQPLLSTFFPIIITYQHIILRCKILAVCKRRQSDVNKNHFNERSVMQDYMSCISVLME
jgi:hypothetical protein